MAFEDRGAAAKDQRKLFAKLTPAAARTLAPTSRLTALSHIAAQAMLAGTLMLKLACALSTSLKRAQSFEIATEAAWRSFAHTRDRAEVINKFLDRDRSSSCHLACCILTRAFPAKCKRCMCHLRRRWSRNNDMVLKHF